MSYQVLARKWRPQVFEDLVGQKAVVRILKNSLESKQLHPALIFSGPRGTGKTSTARILAKSINCLKAKNYKPCNDCKTCKDIDKSRSLDVMEIDGASNNGVEAVRQLKETITYLPTGPYKIYIIDEVHMLSVSAFNALLKTLEEPPSHVMFIMATTEMRKIPSTVISRCQILSFCQISEALIYDQLKKICDMENITAENKALWMLAREAQGSLRDAQGLLDQMNTFCQKNFTAQNVGEILGLSDRSILVNFISVFLQKSPEKIPNLLYQLQTKGVDPSVFLHNLIKELRHLILIKCAILYPSNKIDNLVPLSQEEIEEFLKLVEPLSYEDLHLLMDMALKGSWEITRVQDPKIFLEMLLLKMSQAPYIESLFGGDISHSQQKECLKNEQKPSENESLKKKPMINSKKKIPLTSEKKNLTLTANNTNLHEDQTQHPESSIQKSTNNTHLHKDQRLNSKKKSLTLATSDVKKPLSDVKNHPFIQTVQKVFRADILDSKDL